MYRRGGLIFIVPLWIVRFATGRSLRASRLRPIFLASCILVFPFSWVCAANSASSGASPYGTSRLEQAAGAIPQAERDALIAFYNSTNGPAWIQKTNWLGPPGTEGTWCGVTVENGHVTALRVTGNNLSGAIPPEVSVVTGPVDFYFPFLQSSADSFTGFAVSNFSARAANLTFTAFDESGNPAAAADLGNITLEPQHQFTALGSELFRSLEVGWVRLKSDNADVGSFFQFGGMDQLDGSSAVIGQSKRFYFTRVFEGATAFRGQPANTFLTIANPNDDAVTLKLVLRGVQLPPFASMEAVRTLPAKALLHEAVSQIFRLTSPVASGFVEVEVTAGKGAVGFETVQLPDTRTIIGLNASFGEIRNELYSAQLADGQFAPGVNLFTDLKLVNTSSEQRTVTVRAIANTFNLPVSFVLKPGEQLQTDAGRLFDFIGQQLSPAMGSVRVDASGPGVIGDVIFGDAATYRYAAALPLQARKFTKAVFSHVANASGFYTGIALYNTGSQVANVRIEIFSDQGVLTGRTSLQIIGASRFAALLTEFDAATRGQTGGYVVIESTQPLVGQQLFGDTGLNFLSAVPPTIVNSVQ